MVDAIGVKTVTMADASALRTGSSALASPPPATVAAPVVAAQTPAAAADTAQTQANALARTAAAAAPVDTNRIAEIKHAIANGTFPILPATIADRLMALRLEWNSDDKA